MLSIFSNACWSFRFIFLDKCLSRYFPYFSTGGFYYWAVEALYRFRIQVLSEIRDLQYFLSICNLYLILKFRKQKFWNFDEVQFINFSFIYNNFSVMSNKSLPIIFQKCFSLMFSLEFLKIFSFTSRSMIHFKLVFVCGIW